MAAGWSVEAHGSRPDLARLLAADPQLAGSVRLVRLQPGDLMLWDDRTIHGNAPGRAPAHGQPPPPTAELARASVFVSMSPLALMSPAERRCRRRMAELGLGNGHASHHVPTPATMAAAEAAAVGSVETVSERQLSAAQRAMIPIV